MLAELRRNPVNVSVSFAFELRQPAAGLFTQLLRINLVPHHRIGRPQRQPDTAPVGPRTDTKMLSEHAVPVLHLPTQRLYERLRLQALLALAAYCQRDWPSGPDGSRHR